MPRKKQKKDDTVEGSELPGWPGYRTRPNRSGLDPIDSRAEAGHVAGTLLRRLLTFQVRTRKPIYLVLMFLFGFLPFLALLILIVGGLPGVNTKSLVPIFYLVLILFILGAVTINFLLSILEILGIIPAQRMTQSKVQRREKKLPKRRKDYK